MSQKPHFPRMNDPILFNSVGHQGCFLLRPVIVHVSYFFPWKVNGNLHSRFGLGPEIVLHIWSSPTEVVFRVLVVVIVVLATEEINAQINSFVIAYELI